MATVKVECDHCGRNVRLRRDGTYGKHGWATDLECDNSRLPYAFHAADINVIERDQDGKPTQLEILCHCTETWTGTDQAFIEALWRGHRREQETKPGNQLYREHVQAHGPALKGAVAQ